MKEPMKHARHIMLVAVLLCPLLAGRCHAMLISTDSAADNAENAHQVISRRLAQQTTPENARRNIQREMEPKLTALAIIKGFIAPPNRVTRNRDAAEFDKYDNSLAYKLGVASAALGIPAALFLIFYLLTRRAMAVRAREKSQAEIVLTPIVIKLPGGSGATREVTLNDFLNSPTVRAAEKQSDPPPFSAGQSVTPLPG